MVIFKRLFLSGFRGVRERLDLPLSSGFVVLVGRNGSGKSTICDAIEFALTGRFRASERTENRESLSDYFWWKGAGAPSEFFVELTLQSGDGRQIVIRRTNTDVTVTGTQHSLEDELCELEGRPSDSVPRLCRTSIIRDEEITQLSVDLSETERFEFVRHALGGDHFGDLEQRAKSVQSLLESGSGRALGTYNASRQKLADVTARLSAARAEAVVQGDVAASEQTIREVLGQQSDEEALANIPAAVTPILADRRLRIDRLQHLAQRLTSNRQRYAEVVNPSYNEQIATQEQQITGLQERLQALDRDISQLQDESERLSEKQPRIASLASLHNAGSALIPGDAERCPLCGSPIARANYVAHLASLEQEIRASSESALVLADKLSNLRGNRRTLQQELSVAESQAIAAKGEQQRLTDELNDIDREFRDNARAQAEVPVSEYSVLGEIERLRAELSLLERAVAVLESSRTYERIGQLESEVASARNMAADAEREMVRLNKATERAKLAVNTIRRVRGEIADESLSELDPLLSELYTRLRPHADWQGIGYRLRGDVRKFLSFEVGDGLNPRFVFSSGQRRAAGIAFLIAVYLSRPWCRLRTLVMDDPVQHIDDFRALNLTELLAAVRRSGRQLICTTEDDALAELMCRRFCVGSDHDEGSLVHMSHDSAKGIHVASVRPIRPQNARVLVPAS